MRLGRAAVEAGFAGAVDRLGLAPRSAETGDGAPRAVVQALLELRGAACKVAQFLSLEADLLPEELARECARATHRPPPMGTSSDRTTSRTNVAPIGERFAAFDPVAFAAASLGQVHAATAPDGMALAVKVQYPGIAEAIRSDLRLLRRGLALLPRRVDHERLLSEVEERLLEECDYVREADVIEWFAERLHIPGVRIPRPDRSRSGRTVLSVEHVPGKHLDDWLLDSPCSQVRDAAAQRLYDVFSTCMHELGRIHADPNPGNFLFGGDGSVGLVDFGCTRWIPDDYRRIVVHIWRAAIDGDDAASLRVYREMGMFEGQTNDAIRRADDEFLKPFREWLAAPMRADRFRFGADAAFVSDGRTRFGRMLQNQVLFGIRPEFILVNRTLYGLYRIFERLGATVRCRTRWMSA